MNLSEKEGKKLIKLARESIEEEFTEKKPVISKKGFMGERWGVFVTLTLNEQLRGCIGFPYAVLPLGEAVYQAAKSAAFGDPRFPQLNKEELKNIKIEISILTQPKEIRADPAEIKIGEDGLICQYAGHSGLLLPQVATEHNMDAEEFLQCVCEKAGLSKDAWKLKDFKLYKFQAQVFKET